MTVNEIRVTAEPICLRHRVRRLDLFGSFARGEAREGSDIDFCVPKMWQDVGQAFFFNH